ncbi:MAG: hypothetical protein ACYDBJ_19995 [Aggregatilineales bacterium]
MQNPNAIRPANITLDKTAGVLVIDWPDGQKSHYPLPQLREASKHIIH